MDGACERTLKAVMLALGHTEVEVKDEHWQAADNYAAPVGVKTGVGIEGTRMVLKPKPEAIG